MSHPDPEPVPGPTLQEEHLQPPAPGGGRQEVLRQPPDPRQGGRQEDLQPLPGLRQHPGLQVTSDIKRCQGNFAIIFQSMPRDHNCLVNKSTAPDSVDIVGC